MKASRRKQLAQDLQLRRLRSAWPGRFVPVSAYPRAWKPSHGASIGAVVCFMHPEVFEDLKGIVRGDTKE